MTNSSQNENEYITLFQAAKLCPYSEPYLRLRARQGKLKSIKLGKKWATTAQWVKDYTEKANEWKERLTAKKMAAMFANNQNGQKNFVPEHSYTTEKNPKEAALNKNDILIESKNVFQPSRMEKMPCSSEDLTTEIDHQNGVEISNKYEMPHFEFVIASGLMFAILMFFGIAMSQDFLLNPNGPNEQMISAGRASLSGQTASQLYGNGITTSSVQSCYCNFQEIFSDGAKSNDQNQGQISKEDFLSRTIISLAIKINNFRFPWE